MGLSRRDFLKVSAAGGLMVASKPQSGAGGGPGARHTPA